MKNGISYETCDTLSKRTYTTPDDGNMPTCSSECQKPDKKPNTS